MALSVRSLFPNLSSFFSSNRSHNGKLTRLHGRLAFCPISFSNFLVFANIKQSVLYYQLTNLIQLI